MPSSTRTDAAKLKQSQDFDRLHEDVKNFVSQHAAGQSQLADLVTTEHTKTRDHAAERVEHAQKMIEKEVKAIPAKAASENQRQQLLQSFKYPGMNERRNHIKESHSGTFQWVLHSKNNSLDHNVQSNPSGDTDEVGPEAEDDESDWRTVSSFDDDKSADDQLATGKEDEVEPQRSSELPTAVPSSSMKPTRSELAFPFLDWLQSEESIYWISGKPGSGKSTLIKYIIEAHETPAALQKWRPGAIILSHYFWKPGGGLQRSIKGFWCSIAYQRLAGDEPLLDFVLDQFPATRFHHAPNDWSLKSLEEACLAILERSSIPLSIFIDGLDEIDDSDGVPALQEVISKITPRIGSHVKFCLGSRPEPRFQVWLKNVPELKLHELTKGDMVTWVNDKLSAHKEIFVRLSAPASVYCSGGSRDLMEQISRALVSKAAGVFIWLVMATESVIRGLQDDNSEEEISARIDQFPDEIEGLYDEMWQRMNDKGIYRETSAAFFNYMIFSRERNYEATILIEILIATTPEYRRESFWDKIKLDMSWWDQQCEKVARQIKIRCAGLLEVTQTERDPPNQWKSSVDFIHRTAYDYLTTTVSGRAICSFDKLSPASTIANAITAVWAATLFGHWEPKHHVRAFLHLFSIQARNFSDAEILPLINLIFRLATRFDGIVNSPDPSTALQLEYVLGEVLSYCSTPWAAGHMMTIGWLAIDALQTFQGSGIDNTNLLRNMSETWLLNHQISERANLTTASYQQWISGMMRLLELGADPTIVGPVLGDGPERRGDARKHIRRMGSAAEIFLYMWIETLSRWDLIGNPAVFDLLLALLKHQDLTRPTIIVKSLVDQLWFSTEYSNHQASNDILFVFRVNLAHLLYPILFQNAHLPEPSVPVLGELRALYDSTPQQPARLIGILADDSKVLAGKHDYIIAIGQRADYKCYRVNHDSPLLRTTLTVEELWLDLPESSHSSETPTMRRSDTVWLVTKGLECGLLGKYQGTLACFLAEEGICYEKIS